MRELVRGVGVLVVDDDAAIREAIGEALLAEGLVVTEARDGRDALSQLQAGQRPSVILLDLRMPVMDGIEFRKEQLREPSLRGIPVIVLSANADARDQVRSLGVSEFLRKPLDLDALLAAIARAARPASSRYGEADGVGSAPETNATCAE